MKGLEVAGVTNAVKIPAGRSGHKSDNMRGRLQNDVLDKHPQWMTLSCGVNDVWHGARGVPLDAYKTNISNILDRCAEAGVKVVVLTATMIGEDPNNVNNRRLAAYNDFLREEAAARSLPLADLNADMQALLKTYPPEVKGNKLTADGVHMAWDGNRMMARGVLRAFGVPEEALPKIEKAWRQIRGFREYRISVSADEAKAIEERAKADGRNVVESARDFLLGK
jgi:lysophospholipase L1-like esterase